MIESDNINNSDYAKLEQVTIFFLIDMMDWYSDALRRGLFTRNHIIIFDRYVYSMMYYLTPDVYQHKDNSFNYFDLFLNSIIDHPIFRILPKADILLKMKTSPEAIEKGINRRGKRKDVYEKNSQYMNDVNLFFNNYDFNEYLNKDNYKGLKHQFDIDTIDKDPETIFNDILKKINPIVNRFDKRKW